MTFIAAQTLTGGVVAMPENCFERIIRLQRSVVGRQGMANGARTDLALGRVTGIAHRVGVDARLDRLAGTRRRVTGGTSLSRFAFTLIMRRVIKFQIEPLDKLCRKDFHRRLI